MNKRIFVKKRSGFDVATKELLHHLRIHFNLRVRSIDVYVIYDVFDIDEDAFAYAQKHIFTEVMVDEAFENVKLDNKSFIAYEPIPGQYDQRADSALSCLRLYQPNTKARVTSGTLVVFDSVLEEDTLHKIQKYLINPIESVKKDLTVLYYDQNVEVTPLKEYTHFLLLNEEELDNFLKNEHLAMSLEDLKMIQEYFRLEKRIPTETELKVLDTYWSDHCRHTTFQTILDSITFTTDHFKEELEKAFQLYISLKNQTSSKEKPITLMDMATINARYLRSKGQLQDVEISDEINACSVYVDVDHNGIDEKWLVMFKNETHNHPTEIEPFGGASTCIGGAIRDPLSGRSYVYQAARISGCGNVLEKIEQTLPFKLPQSIISKKATQGYSSYGNQIGLATSFVKEIYHDSYVAKHLELGAVVGAVKAEYVKRLKPISGDVVILLGGKTGRDGIGGATGSSKQHTEQSLVKSASEVQKGNAVEQRKIQRFMRNPKATLLIKKCNDFGAGGVSVAIAELADGLVIDLDSIKVKYAGLNAMELAISESQERMAVVVSSEDAETFIKIANEENLDAYIVAKVIEEPRLIMLKNQQEVVNLSREFINTNGYQQKVKVEVATIGISNPFTPIELTKTNILTMLSDLNVCNQKGLVEHFDSTIGSSTVLMPYGGKHQATKTQASVSKIPMLDGKTSTCTILTYGFNPKISEYSTYLMSQYAILDSIAKTIAVGGNLKSIHFSFQEYFRRLTTPSKWGLVVETLLGAIKVLDFFSKAAIGGKDSMSGTYQHLDVVSTFVSFACSNAKIDTIISPEFKRVGNYISLIKPNISSDGLPDLTSYRTNFQLVESLIASKVIKSAYVVEDGGIASALFHMSFGNGFTFELNTKEELLSLLPGCFVVESEEIIDDAILIGRVSDDVYRINEIELTKHEVLNHFNKPLKMLYPLHVLPTYKQVETISYKTDKIFKAKQQYDEVSVLIPVFFGTNCEYDMARAFEEEGAKTTIYVFKNYQEDAIFKSIDEFVTLIEKSQILALAGGFSAGDEPDGSAKFIVNILRNEKVKEAIDAFLAREGLILGICNGFQALIKSGLLPYGKITDLTKDDATLFKNDIHRHVSCIAKTKVSSNNSPWLSMEEVDRIDVIPISHGEGKFVCSEELLQTLIKNGQIAYQYVDDQGQATMDKEHNFNGSMFAIEGIISPCGQILGKMGHSERYVDGLYKNIVGNKKQSIFKNGVAFFKKENKHE